MSSSTTFNKAALVAKLEQLPPVSRAAFAASCAERLLPAYRDFSIQTGRGDAKLLGELLARLWDDLGGHTMRPDELGESIDLCMALIPDDDEGPWTEAQAAGEDAVAAVAYALRCRQNGRSQEAARSARRAYEALDEYVITRESIDLNGEDAKARVLAHPLVQAELARQQRDLNELTSTGDPLAAAVRLRDRASTEGEVFFGSSPAP